MGEIIVVSGINLVDGGALSVYYDFLDSVIDSNDYKRNNYIVLVSKKSLFTKYKNKFKILEFPKSKESWLKRLYYEYWYFYKLSKKLKPDVWLSMHDITPNVRAKRRFVYCHNPSPFYRMPISKIKYGWKYYAFSKLYKYLYKINIHKNTAVIVQQKWMADNFKKLFNVKNVIVAKPSVNISIVERKREREKNFTFIYPSYPRVYKNFEVVCEAVKLLNSEKHNFKVYVTLAGTENNYSKMLFKRYGNIKNIEFIGLLKRSYLISLYSKTNCLLFMSQLETWGMPISEYKKTGNKIIVADLPYAHETVGNYRNVVFVNPNSSRSLKAAMKKAMEEKKFVHRYVETKSDDYIYVQNWDELIKVITDD